MLSFSSLCSNVASTRSRHTDWLTRDAACCWGALQLNSLCCNLFSISPCSDRRWPCVLRETLHPLDHDARSKGELHSTGARRGDGPAISCQWTIELGCKETREPRKDYFSNPPPPLNSCHTSLGELCQMCPHPRWECVSSIFTLPWP